jgi:hypothetical protein
MKKLWIIGDSFSAGFNAPNEGPLSFKNRYSNYKGYTPKFFGEFVSESLGIEYEILTPFPCDNSRMFSVFIEHLDNFKDGDIISFGWTGQPRLRVVNTKHNCWVVVNPHKMMEDDLNHDFSVQSLVEMSVNRMHPYYMEELKLWMVAVNRLVPKCKVIHWSWTEKWLDTEFESIKNETKDFIDDFHWSENGHREFAKWFLEVYDGNIINECYK